jgi:hypothetical protein
VDPTQSIFVALKSSQVTSEQAKRVADQHNMFFAEVSSHHDSRDIKQIFNMLVKEVAQRNYEELI